MPRILRGRKQASSLSVCRGFCKTLIIYSFTAVYHFDVIVSQYSLLRGLNVIVLKSRQQQAAAQITRLNCLVCCWSRSRFRIAHASTYRVCCNDLPGRTASHSITTVHTEYCKMKQVEYTTAEIKYSSTVREFRCPTKIGHPYFYLFGPLSLI